MSEFPKSSPNLDALVKSATRFEDIAQLCRNDFAQRGLVPEAQPAQPAAPVVDNGWGCSRIIFIGNSRLELHSSSEYGLDQQEARIRSVLGR